jgi:hypothetical protein
MVPLSLEGIGLHREDEVQSLLAKVFGEDLGKLRGVTAKLYVDPEARPVFYKARPVPYALRQKVEQELDRLEKENVVEKVQFSEWASSIVPVVKQNRDVRICGDYKERSSQ